MIDWLSQTLGFDRQAAGKAPSGILAQAGLVCGGGMILPAGAADIGGETFRGAPRKLARGPYSHSNIDELYAVAAAAGAAAVVDIGDREYASHAFSPRDPESRI